MPGSRAELNNFRVSARKARLVADQVRGRPVEEALSLLELSPRRFSRPLAKLLRSAVANAAEHNSRRNAGLDVDNLVVARVTVGEGRSIWRIRARAQGRAGWIQKRTSNIRVELEER